jgi:hypothetical protein
MWTWIKRIDATVVILLAIALSLVGWGLLVNFGGGCKKTEPVVEEPATETPADDDSAGDDDSAADDDSAE